MRDRFEERERVYRVLAIVGALVIVVAILWIDVATGIWQDLVIAAGLAAGLVTFLLTALVLNRIVARNAERRWAPLNRLAVTEFLHAIADEDRSEIAHGIIVPRELPAVPESVSGPELQESLHGLREVVAAERRDLADALSRWAEFLTTSGDNELILRHVADIALYLDVVRDTALTVERAPSAAAQAELAIAVKTCNRHFQAISAELQRRLAADTKLALE